MLIYPPLSNRSIQSVQSFLWCLAKNTYTHTETRTKTLPLWLLCCVLRIYSRIENSLTKRKNTDSNRCKHKQSGGGGGMGTSCLVAQKQQSDWIKQGATLCLPPSSFTQWVRHTVQLRLHNPTSTTRFLVRRRRNHGKFCVRSISVSGTVLLLLPFFLLLHVCLGLLRVGQQRCIL